MRMKSLLLASVFCFQVAMPSFAQEVSDERIKALVAEALRAHLATRGGTMPNILFANGVTALEGLLQVTAGPGLDLLRGSVIGCYDWDPFAANLPLDITFVRQDVEALIGAGFHLLDTVEKGGNPTLRVPASIRRAPEPDP